MDELVLDIKNFGSVGEAHIKLGKLNIVAGVNGSGKSILSKLLFCFLVANSKDVFNVLLNSEFNFSELKDYKKAYVNFHGSINDCKFAHEIDFKAEKIGVKINEGHVDCLNFEDVVYIDSPAIFDFKNNSNKNLYHLNQLSKALHARNEVYPDIVKFQNKFNNLLNGNFCYDFKKQNFVFKQGDNEYSMKNTASGIKQIGVIQVLLENRNLKENSFLFIDEPESNLHPDWQVKLAEILVLLVKELNIYLYINSHSPQFIEALEVFSVKYGLSDETKFYLSKKSDNNKFKFEEIDYDSLVILYNDLGDSYDIIDEIRAENIFNKLNG